MHRFLLWTFLFLFSAETLQAQTTRDIGKIVLGVKILPSASAETHALGEYLSDIHRLGSLIVIHPREG